MYSGKIAVPPDGGGIRKLFSKITVFKDNCLFIFELKLKKNFDHSYVNYYYT
jgi:hypothetical protein